MPASAAQVFGPVTVNPNFKNTGEKTLLTMNTTLPAGGKNVIIATMALPSAMGSTGKFRLRIKKGATILYETIADYGGGGAQQNPRTIFALDESPAGNDTYTFTINILTATSSSAAVHVQAIVIKSDDAVIASNTATVTIANGTTSDILSLATTFASGSKVAIIATVSVNTATSTVTRYQTTAGNPSLVRDTTVVTANEYFIRVAYPFGQGGENIIVLPWLETLSTSNPTYRIRIANNSGTNLAAFGQIVAFTVSDGAYLDGASTGLSNGVQVTVGNLTTALSGDVATIAVGAYNYPSNTGSIFNAGDVVLQLNNSATGQVSNAVALSGSDIPIAAHLPLFRLDIGVSNPSYQIKMTARASGINGEAKILAFVLFTGLAIKRVFGETVRELEGSIFGRSRFRISAETVRLSELGRAARNLVRRSLEEINLIESVVRSRIWVRIIGESERVSEAFRGLRSRFSHVSESLSVSEASARIRRLFRTVAESVSLSEITSRARVMARMAGETVRSLETAVRSRIMTRVANEVARITELFNSARGKALSFVEGLRISEAVRHVRIMVRSASEQMRISEALSKAVTFVKVLGEALDLSEAFKAGRDRFRSVGESLGVSELAVSFKGAVRVVGEALNLGELSQVMRNRFRQVEEAIDIGEAFARFRVVVRVVLEPVAMLENQLAARLRARAVDEIVNVGETLVRFKGKVLDIVEVVVVTEIRLFKKLKVYIDRLASTLKGMSRSTLKGMSRSRLGGKL